MDATVGLHLESIRFAQQEVFRTAALVQRAVMHRELMSKLQIEPAVALANRHCRVAGGQLRAAMNKHAHSIRQL